MESNKRRVDSISRWYEKVSKDCIQISDRMLAEREQGRKAIKRELDRHKEIELKELKVRGMKRFWKKLQAFFGCEPQLTRLSLPRTSLFLIRPHGLPGHAVVYLLERIEQLSSSGHQVRVEVLPEEMSDGVLWVRQELEGKQIVQQVECLEEQAWCVVSRPVSQCTDSEARH